MLALHSCPIPSDQHKRCPEEHHRHPNSSCMSTGEMTGPQISPKSDQSAKISTFRKPLTEMVQSKSAASCRQAPIRDLLELESHQQFATLAETHHNATIYEKNDSVLGQQQKQSSEKNIGKPRRVHTTIRIKRPLNLTRSEGNTTKCRPRMRGLRQLNNVS